MTVICDSFKLVFWVFLHFPPLFEIILFLCILLNLQKVKTLTKKHMKSKSLEVRLVSLPNCIQRATVTSLDSMNQRSFLSHDWWHHSFSLNASKRLISTDEIMKNKNHCQITHFIFKILQIDTNLALFTFFVCRIIIIISCTIIVYCISLHTGTW